MRQLILIVALLASIGSGSALGSPADVVRDFRANGQITRDFTHEDTQAALELVGPDERRALGDAIIGRYYVSLLGVRPAPRAAAPAPGEQVAAERPPRVANELSRPDELIPTPLREPATGLPLFVAVLAGLAGGLMLAGAASGIALRRLRRLH